MGKKLSMLLLALFVAVVPTTTTGALSLLGGQKHFYTVQLRSDAQALVYAKIIFENTGQEPLSTYRFTLPDGVTADNLAIQQILAHKMGPQECKTYETLQEWRIRASQNRYLPSDSSYEAEKRCLVPADTAPAYDEDFDFEKNMSSSTDYYYYSYYQRLDNTYEYKDIEPKQEGTTYTVTLPTEIKAKKQGAVLISFSTKNFVSQSLGQYAFTVRTLKTEQMIDSATVAINFDEDVYSRDSVKQQRTSSSPTSSKADVLEGASAAQGYQSDSTDILQLSVGRGGTFVQRQTKMLPGDMMSVRGVYATEKAFLFLNEILASVLLVVLLGILLWRWVLRERKHRASAPLVKKEAVKVTKLAETPSASLAASPITATLVKRGFAISGVSIVGTLVVGAVIGSMLDTLSYSGQFVSTFLIPAGVMAFVAMGLFVAPLLFALRYGATSAFVWSLIHAALLVVALVLIWVVINTATSSSNYSYPTMPLDRLY